MPRQSTYFRRDKGNDASALLSYRKASRGPMEPLELIPACLKLDRAAAPQVTNLNVYQTPDGGRIGYMLML